MSEPDSLVSQIFRWNAILPDAQVVEVPPESAAGSTASSVTTIHTVFHTTRTVTAAPENRAVKVLVEAARL